MSVSRLAQDGVQVAIVGQTAQARAADIASEIAIASGTASARAADIAIEVAVRTVPPNQSGITMALRR